MAARRPRERPSSVSVRGRAPAGVRGGSEADGIGARSGAARAGAGARGRCAGACGAPRRAGLGAPRRRRRAGRRRAAAASAAGTGGWPSGSAGLGCGPKAAWAPPRLGSAGGLVGASWPRRPRASASPSFGLSSGLASVPGGGTAAPLPVPFCGAVVPAWPRSAAGRSRRGRRGGGRRRDARRGRRAALLGGGRRRRGGPRRRRGGAGATRRCASAVTRASSSAARSGARPAHSRRRLTSRACAKYSSDRMPSPKTAATPA